MGMMPARAFTPGVITPGQLGPMSTVPAPRSERFTFTMSSVGMPSVMQTATGTPAPAASRMASAEKAAGTKISETFASKLLDGLGDGVANGHVLRSPGPPRPGVTPATTFVP